LFSDSGGPNRPPLPDFDDEDDDGLLDVPSQPESEEGFTNPVATAAEVLSSDARGGGLTGANGSSSGLFGGDR
jgi:hypothetical protein